MRHLAAILAIAGLATGYAPAAAVGGHVDDFDRERAEKRAALAHAERERERREWAARRNARLQREIEETRRRHEDIRKLKAGIDPTNDGPLSRQQRRQLRRRGFKFDGEVRA